MSDLSVKTLSATYIIQFMQLLPSITRRLEGRILFSLNLVVRKTPRKPYIPVIINLFKMIWFSFQLMYFTTSELGAYKERYVRPLVYSAI